MSPSIPAYIQQTDHWWSLQTLLSQQALAIYRRHGGRIGTYKALLETLPQAAQRLPASPPGNPKWFLDRIKARQQQAQDRAYHF